MRHVLSILLLLGLTACNAGTETPGMEANQTAESASETTRRPEETRPPEAGYEPAFGNQTRA
ncbi:MAG: hypothetical protein KGY53_06210, partial [Wenzhouxiangellaceae bacterium]|nr:hypothetical protein [Wenzhouxiangellaceae bacterium]